MAIIVTDDSWGYWRRELGRYIQHYKDHYKNRIKFELYCSNINLGEVSGAQAGRPFEVKRLPAFDFVRMAVPEERQHRVFPPSVLDYITQQSDPRPPGSPGIILSREEILILGAGATGLFAALRAFDLGIKKWQLLEQWNVVGGLARSMRDEYGFTWDFGTHVIPLKSGYDYFDSAMDWLLPNQWAEHQRIALNWIDGQFVPYPYQPEYSPIAPSIATEGRPLGLLNPRAMILDRLGSKPRNLEEWLTRNMGSGFAEEFMIPYNRKIWQTEPSELSFDWSVHDRVASVDLVSTLLSWSVWPRENRLGV